MIEALADRAAGIYPARITHPAPGASVFHAPFFGAPVEVGAAFTVLLSTGQVVAL